MSETAGEQNELLELYKLCVESAEKVSDRRQAANSFFLTINTAVIGLGAYVHWAFLLPIAGTVLCYTWYRLILSYRGLNGGKFKVILEMETSLAAQPFADEWSALGRGKDPALYRPFTKIETTVPWVFFGLHLAVLALDVYKLAAW